MSGAWQTWGFVVLLWHLYIWCELGLTPYEEGGYMLCKGRLIFFKMGNVLKKKQNVPLQKEELFNNELLAHFVKEQLCAYNKASINTSNEKARSLCIKEWTR